MNDLKSIYYELKNNEELNEICVKTFYIWKNDKIDDTYAIDILETWLESKLHYDNLTYSLICSLYYLLKYDILSTHEFMF